MGFEVVMKQYFICVSYTTSSLYLVFPPRASSDLIFLFRVCLCGFSVRAGVGHFKHGRHVEAMNEYNKALDMDTDNVEALVARGAL